MIKKLASHLGEYKRAAILTPMFAALEAVMDILLPTIMAFIIDLGIEKGDMNAIVKYGLLTFAVAAIALLLGVLAGKYAAEASTGFAGNLRDAMYENIQHYSFSNIDKFSTAGLVTRMTTDVTNLQNAFQMMERMCVRAPVHLVFALIMAFSIGGPLALIFVVAIAFLLAVLASIMVPTFKIFDRVFKNYDNLNSSVQENVSAIRVVKSFVREGFENEKYTKACEGLYQQFVNAESRLSFNNPVMLTAIYGCNIALSWFGAKYILHGALTTGQLNALFGYIMNILMALMMLSMAFVMISMSAASAKRVRRAEHNRIADGVCELNTILHIVHDLGRRTRLSDLLHRVFECLAVFRFENGLRCRTDQLHAMFCEESALRKLHTKVQASLSAESREHTVRFFF